MQCDEGIMWQLYFLRENMPNFDYLWSIAEEDWRWALSDNGPVFRWEADDILTVWGDFSYVATAPWFGGNIIHASSIPGLGGSDLWLLIFGHTGDFFFLDSANFLVNFAETFTRVFNLGGTGTELYIRWADGPARLPLLQILDLIVPSSQVYRPPPTRNYTATYIYRPDGLRLQKTVNGVQTTHIWCRGQIVLELNTTGGVINRFDRSMRGRLIRSYHHGFYLYNARGDVVQRTNAVNGSVIATYRYSAFGNELTPDASNTNIALSIDNGLQAC